MKKPEIRPQAILMMKGGFSDSEIMEQLNVSPSYITKLRNVIDCKIKNLNPNKVIAVMAELINSKEPYATIAAKHEIAASTVCRFAKFAKEYNIIIKDRNIGRPRNER